MKYELMKVPLSIAELDGSLHTGNKSMLANVLTEGIECPKTINVNPKSSSLIIDGQALVACMKVPANAKTFGDFADIFIHAVIQTGFGFRRIDIVFDQYFQEESITSLLNQYDVL